MSSYILDCDCAGVYGRMKCHLCAFKTSCHAHYQCHMQAHKKKELANGQNDDVNAQTKALQRQGTILQFM